MAPDGHSSEQPLTDKLKSKEHGELLDAMDLLRRQNLDGTIDIPEIVVCGDQSSGKSSVLEAIAGVSFPIGSGTVTRFPTEVILRNVPESKFEARIKPGTAGWNEDQLRQMNAWGHEFDDVSAVLEIVRQARRFLETLDSERTFWYDMLQIEIRGPHQPHLTLIDLPGLIHNDTDIANKSDIVKLTQEYIAREAAVVLAVFDAPADLQRHQIVSLLEEAGAVHRTMGILTMPDELKPGSGKELNRMRMVEDGTRELGLGWHVLKNQQYDPPGDAGAHGSDQAHHSPKRDPNARDEEERKFFLSHPGWSAISAERKGAPKLRTKLSEQLLVRIQQGLPRLMREMNIQLSLCNQFLEQLGDARETEEEKRKYLSGVFEKIFLLIRSALNSGNPEAAYGGFFGDKDERKLRNAINLELEAFSSEMRESGRLYKTWDADEDDEYPSLPRSKKISFSLDQSSDGVQKFYVPFEKYVKLLAEHISKTRGPNLRGTVPPETYSAIFRQQSRPWRSIVEQHTSNCVTLTREFLRAACHYEAGSYTGGKLMDLLIRPAFENRVKTLNDKVEELLWPYLHGLLMIYDGRFNASATTGVLFAGKEDLWESRLTRKYSDPSAEFRAAAKAMDIAEAYYNISLSTFVENIAALGVERCLLHDLDKLVSTSSMMALTPEDINRIAEERREDRLDRTTKKAQREVLKSVLETCLTHNIRQRTTRQDTANLMNTSTSDDLPSLAGSSNDGGTQRTADVNTETRPPPKTKTTIDLTEPLSAQQVASGAPSAPPRPSSTFNFNPPAPLNQAGVSSSVQGIWGQKPRTTPTNRSGNSDLSPDSEARTPTPKNLSSLNSPANLTPFGNPSQKKATNIFAQLGQDGTFDFLGSPPKSADRNDRDQGGSAS